MSDYTQLAPHVLVESQDGVRVLTLNAPDRYNAVDDDMHHALIGAWRLLESDEGACAVVITGAGPAFSAGGDMDHLRNAHNDPVLRRQTIRTAERLIRAAVSCELPVVAAVNGPAVGVGATLALLSDLVVIAEDTYIADPHVSVGLVAGDGGASLWPSYMSMLRAKEHLLLGTPVTADECLRLGIANRVVPNSEVLSAALELGARLAGQPRQAIRDTKRALNMHLRQAVDRTIDFALAAEGESMAGDDVMATVERFTARSARKTSAGASSPR
ncbi:enoyl-CoA hydratase [Mycolicibacterium peregrinum]|uniref:enoyl-CoA hydratase/isomerase family protein n=1 Tax=Mycolicibacterium peregrinum TaxID=43304 RepID=UPI0007EBF832|nr:enoyl-CoA hydratase/isomerase family protein [Mycolicibacterium peregrinum]OBF41904.1 enoyl-CoA hydratase [Mycolicibacterium peregrinum]